MPLALPDCNTAIGAKTPTVEVTAENEKIPTTPSKDVPKTGDTRPNPWLISGAALLMLACAGRLLWYLLKHRKPDSTAAHGPHSQYRRIRSNHAVSACPKPFTLLGVIVYLPAGISVAIFPSVPVLKSLLYLPPSVFVPLTSKENACPVLSEVQAIVSCPSGMDVGEGTTVGFGVAVGAGVGVTLGVGAIVGVGFVTVLAVPPWLTGGTGTGVGSGSFSVRYCV